MSITIDNSKISDTAWGSISKSELGKKLEEAGNKAAIREAYLFVGDPTKRSTFKFPHHQLDGDILVVNRNGVHSAAQRLVSTGATDSKIPKAAAARHLLKHYRAMKEKPPESLDALKGFVDTLTALELMSKFESREEAEMELEMLSLLQTRAYFTEGDDHKAGIFEEKEDILREINSLPYKGLIKSQITIEDVLAAILALEDDPEGNPNQSEETMDPGYVTMEDPTMAGVNSPKPIKSLQDRIDSKGLDVLLSSDNKTLIVKSVMSFSNDGKRNRQDYQPNDDELEKINKITKIDYPKAQLVTFALNSADLAVDRSYEHFTPKALDQMALLSVGKPFLMDHDWTTKSTIGTIYDAAVVNGKLVQKVYMLNSEKNNDLINNILASVHQNVSVGFAVDLNEMHCDSCSNGISYYDEMCMHSVGQKDAIGKTTNITIQGVTDYFETSLVPVPAQRNAGVAGSGKAVLTLGVQKLAPSGSISLTTTTLNKQGVLESSDTIIINEFNLGDPIVTTQIETPEVAAVVEEVTTVVASALEADTDPVVNPEASVKGTDTDPDDNEDGEDKDDKDKEDKEDKDDDEDDMKSKFNDLVNTVETLIKGQEASIKALTEMVEKLSNEKLAELEAVQKAQAEKLDILGQIVESAINETIETKLLTTPTNVNTKLDPIEWVAELNKSFLSGGQ